MSNFDGTFRINEDLFGIDSGRRQQHISKLIISGAINTLSLLDPTRRRASE
jgi:hypothetical protein